MNKKDGYYLLVFISLGYVSSVDHGWNSDSVTMLARLRRYLFFLIKSGSKGINAVTGTCLWNLLKKDRVIDLDCLDYTVFPMGIQPAAPVLQAIDFLGRKQWSYLEEYKLKVIGKTWDQSSWSKCQ